MAMSTLAGNGAGAGLRVLLVEDDALTREVLAAALTGNGYQVHTEADGSIVDRVADAFRPDMALIDVHLGDGVDGFTVARRLRQAGDTPVMFLTAAREPEDVAAGFEVGADDYLVKPFTMAELSARMQAVLRRCGRLGGHHLYEVADLVVDVDAYSASRDGHLVDLTQREFAVLVMLVRHHGMVLSKLQLLTEVWGYEHYDLNVVEVHVSGLRRKLEEHGPRLIHTVRGAGYVLRP